MAKEFKEVQVSQPPSQYLGYAYPKIDSVKVLLNDGTFMHLVFPNNSLMFEQDEVDKYWNLVKESKGKIVVERIIKDELPFKSFMNHLWNECNPHKDLLFERKGNG
jgi:hypothetical protein